MPAIDTIVLKNQALAVVFNIWSWILAQVPRGLRNSLRRPPLPPPRDPTRRAVSIAGPGGLDRLELIDLGDRASVGYNLREFCPPPLTPPLPDSPMDLAKTLPAHTVLVRVSHFSINYADTTIRWGLYESALRFVGWPIVPGFDLAGTVEWAGAESGLKAGDDVVGFTMFGAYSTRVLVPGRQLAKRPANFSAAEAAAMPAVLGTALHAAYVTSFWPEQPITQGRAVLVHSAAGGVGSMLLQVLRLQGANPIVAVVGSAHKKSVCEALGAHVVVDKSKEDLWSAAEQAAPGGYAAIYDANGVSTLKASYDHLSQCGRLAVYGFHSNLPMGVSMISPFAWLGMIKSMISMALTSSFEAMDLVLASKSVHGFNLSFFANETELTSRYLKQMMDWITAGKVQVAKVTEFGMREVGAAHELIQSGKSVGKIVVRTAED
eukprot:gnl/TRDRNA2_/TRDRNA2_193754_c0_seq1.p1 gnl/TRDRNA2_/TRDRNA2_193754_c0~~gnl/TRDRNA2_/TRDRNA2_193754_c0_seq1.p1  ORF type:complete len:434 (+),score=70.44 gnl/TRDRNA2_/TRDRNA2_193754_c0_seq1:74-1375(+)